MEQINLNRPEIWPERTPFRARSMAVALVLVVVGLGAAYVWAETRVARQRDALESVQAQRQQLQERLARVERKHEARQQSLEQLRSRTRDLQTRLASLRRAEKALGNRLRAAGRKAELVRSLGRARSLQGGIWLTRFRLQGVTEVSLRVEGRALRPEAVPRYLEAITAQKPYGKGYFQDIDARLPKGGEQADRQGVLHFQSEARFPLQDGKGPG